MATLFPAGAGWAIQWREGAERQRQTLRLPKMPRRSADHVLRHVENLIGSKVAAGPVDQETSRWLGQIDSHLRLKMARCGLVPGEHPTCNTLSAIAAASIRARKSNLSRRALANLERTRDLMLDHLGDRPVGTITEADAKAFRTWRLEAGLAEATVRKQCNLARSILNHAIDARLIEANPFAAVPTTAVAQANPEYVTQEDAQRVMEALPTGDWRLLFALARWGGLRVPGEAARMRWEDVLWDRGRFRVRSTKTAKSGKGERMTPLFPEVLTVLREAFERAPAGAVRVLPGLRPDATGSTVRATLQTAIRRAGVPVWGNLWRTLRASRQTDLERQYPLHVVCAWLGNTSQVAARHYLRITDEHWSQASGSQEAAESAALGAAQA